MSPWDTGRGQPLADAAIMSIAPVGIVNAGDPAQAYLDAFALAGLHQDGIERDAAATVAAATAAALAPGATVAGVVAAMRAHSTFDVRRLVDMAIEDAGAVPDADAFADRFHARLLDRSFPLPPGEAWDRERSVSPTSREVLPAVVGLLLLCDGDPNAAIVEGASLGRDADTIATLLGSLTGALRGASAIRPDWIAASERANAAFFAEVEGDPAAGFLHMAERMVGAVAAERRRALERHAALTALLGDAA